MRNRVEESWRSFEDAVLGPTIGAVQRREMRRAFFAGAFSIMDALSNAVSHGDEMTGDDEQMMIDLASEQAAYLAALKAGRA